QHEPPIVRLAYASPRDDQQVTTFWRVWTILLASGDFALALGAIAMAVVMLLNSGRYWDEEKTAAVIYGGIMVLWLGAGLALIFRRRWTFIMIVHMLAAAACIALAGFGVAMMVYYKYEQGWPGVGLAVGIAATITATIGTA